MNYYNEFDPRAAAWLRALIAEKIIPEGKVDERDIKEVVGADLVGFIQCHFFAGIGGWSRALQLANWPANRPVWTGSCPCQPLSSAGQRRGEKDERHLWPEFYRLISECRPPAVLGEQVASKDGIEWLDGISLDLEELSYAVASSDLPSASVRSPNIRQRSWWLATANHHEYGRGLQRLGEGKTELGEGAPNQPTRTGVDGGLAYTGHGTGCAEQGNELQERGGRPWQSGDSGMGQPDSAGFISREPSTSPSGHGDSTESASGVGQADANDPRPQGRFSGVMPECSDEQSAREVGSSSFWSNAIWHPCSDGKIRRIPTEPILQCVAPGLSDDLDIVRAAGGFPLAPSLKGRVALLKGYGNAINPEVAAEFIRAYVETMQHRG